MFVLDRRKMAPEGGDGTYAGGSGENPPTKVSGDTNPEGSGQKDSGNSGLKSLYDSTKADMLKYKKELRDARAKLAEFDEAQKVAEEKKLLEQENYKELLEKRDAEIAEWKGKVENLSGEISNFKTREVQGQKLQAFMDGADFQVDSKYLGFIDLDRIKVDEGGNIDATSIQETRELFLKEHPSLVKKSSKTPKFSQPGNAPSSTKVSRQQNLMDYVRNPRLSIERASQGLIED